jgi:hypothetical protein
MTTNEKGPQGPEVKEKKSSLIRAKIKALEAEIKALEKELDAELAKEAAENPRAWATLTSAKGDTVKLPLNEAEVQFPDEIDSDDLGYSLYPMLDKKPPYVIVACDGYYEGPYYYPSGTEVFVGSKDDFGGFTVEVEAAAQEEQAAKAVTSVREQVDHLAEGSEKVDLSTITSGTKIMIKQPAGTHYNTGSDADAGENPIELQESWIETTVALVHPDDDPDNRFIETSEIIYLGPYTLNEFTESQIFYRNGVLHADPERD